MHETVDSMDEKISSRQTLDLLADKWSALVIHTLRFGTLRFSDLQREIEGISQKMLIQTLRKLEQDGLLERHVYPVVPPHVEYTLTPLGQTLLEPLHILCAWGRQHLSEVYAARAKFGKRA